MKGPGVFLFSGEGGGVFAWVRHIPLSSLNISPSSFGRYPPFSGIEGGGGKGVWRKS